MTYNRTEIFTRANALRGTHNLGKSEALAKSWGMAKLAALEGQKSMLEYADRRSGSQWDEVNRLDREIVSLRDRIYPRVTRTERYWSHYMSQKSLQARMDRAAAAHGTDSAEYREWSREMETAWGTREWVGIDLNAYDAA